MQQDAPEGVAGAPLPDNIMAWNAVIYGPPDTPFEDGTASGTRSPDLSSSFCSH